MSDMSAGMMKFRRVSADGRNISMYLSYSRRAASCADTIYEPLPQAQDVKYLRITSMCDRMQMYNILELIWTNASPGINIFSLSGNICTSHSRNSNGYSNVGPSST
jgi:hypothetical protein